MHGDVLVAWLIFRLRLGWPVPVDTLALVALVAQIALVLCHNPAW
jgi:hypothetical protein